MSRKPYPAEVIVRIISAHSDSFEEDDKSEYEKKKNLGSYNALIYAPSDLLTSDSTISIPEDQARTLRDMPLAMIEKVVVDWDYYKDYLRSFLFGEKSALEGLGRDKIFCEVSGDLSSLLSGKLISNRPLRVWWDLVNPKLFELPWELLAYTEEGYDLSEISLVRGLPPTNSVPRVPVGKQLRLAFIHEPNSTSAALIAALQGLPQISVSDMTDPPLEALQRALQDGYELIHLVADGSTSLAYEGYLYLRRPSRLRYLDSSASYENSYVRRARRLWLNLYKLLEPFLPARQSAWINKRLFDLLALDKLTPAELSSMQRGRPLSILCLSPPKSSDKDPGRIDGVLLPGVFRAFSCLGNSPLPMPNIVAQVGATDETNMESFWHHFYLELSQSLVIESAMSAGLKASSPQPFALFLRQRQRNTFERDKPSENVTQINAELEESRETVEELRALLGQNDSMSALVAKYEERETARQQHLEEKLLPYLQEGE